VWQSVKT